MAEAGGVGRSNRTDNTQLIDFATRSISTNIENRGIATRNTHTSFSSLQPQQQFDTIPSTMVSKDRILDEVRRTAEENAGTPLGAGRFQKETGINANEWGKHWARWGDALVAAGFRPNQRTAAYADEFLIQKIIGLARRLSAFPTFRELRVARGSDPEMPDQSSFYRLGGIYEIALKVAQYCEGKSEYKDITSLCAPILAQSNQDEKENKENTESGVVGEVYLFRSGHYYKIGRTNDTVRRGAEIRIQLPERMELIHSILTDDPSGIEAYWHKRFDAKRRGGEWYDLNSGDVRAFKRWKRIY